jgi:hypothetical protein
MDDEERPVRVAYQKYELNYPVAMGDEKIGEMYGSVLGLPVSLLIDTKGKIRSPQEPIGFCIGIQHHSLFFAWMMCQAGRAVCTISHIGKGRCPISS